MLMLFHIIFIVAGQTIHYFFVNTIDMRDVEVEAGEKLPPLYLAVQQTLLGLEVFKTLMVCN